MRVTRLEIFGFKSFVDRFVLNFDENLIAVVGPNGCGKSNIVDALRWVLGETHAKQLRGAIQDDLIFNGSDSKRPMGMAEVSIVIRPDEAWSAASLNQVERELAVIEGGQVEGEAASDVAAEENQPSNGVPAEGSNSNNGSGRPQSVLDIPGIADAAEIQLTRRLYRSGESEYFINRVPCRLRDMVELYRLIGLGSRGLSIVQQGQIGEIISKKPLERRELLEEAAGISGFRARVESAQRKLDKTAQNLARLEDVMSEVEKQVRVLKRQANRAKNREQLKTELREAEISLFKLKTAKVISRSAKVEQQLSEVHREIEGKESALTKARAEVDEVRAVLDVSDQELMELRRSKDRLAEEAGNLRQSEQEYRVKLASLDARAQALQEQQEQLANRLLEVERESEEQQQARAQMQEECSDLAQVQTSLEAELANVVKHNQGVQVAGSQLGSTPVEAGTQKEGELSALRVEQERLRKDLELKDSEIRSAELVSARADAEIASLRTQLDAMGEFVASAVNSQENEAQAENREQVLLSQLSVPEEYQAAVAAVFGEWGSFLVTSDSRGYVEKFLTNRGEKRFGILDKSPIGRRAASVLTAKEREVSPSAKLLLDQLQVSSDLRDLLEAMVGTAVLVDSLDEAFELRELLVSGEAPSDRIWVTKGGEVVVGWGWYVPQGEGASFSFKRRIEERETEAEQARLRLEELEQQREGLRRQVADYEARTQAIIEQRDKLAEAQQEIFAEAMRQEREVQAKVLEVASKLAAAQGQAEFARRRFESLEQQRKSLGQQRLDFSEELESVTAEKTRVSEDWEQKLSNEEEALGSRVAGIEQQLSILVQSIRAQEEKRSEASAQLAEQTTIVEQQRRSLERLHAEERDSSLEREKLVMELSVLKEEIVRIIGEEVSVPTEFEIADLLGEEAAVAQQLEELQETGHRLRRRLEREGEVDPESIELYEQENARLEEMAKQHQDLTAATETLERTIKHLKEVSRTKFVETFESVSRTFKELVPRLYGGGSGSLDLVDPEDPLTSGVEITIRPPGKKLRSMELLSGGEKALAATAILVAMFLHRASPICVLDEVDAPLDDSNLERFLSLIKEISQSTQVLLITHNKQSMTSADRLIGITMQESGVSTALSVSLQEAEEQYESLVGNAV